MQNEPTTPPGGGPADAKPKRTISIPGYKLEKVLGRGAQGTVVKGQREADDLIVAIKLLDDAEEEDFRLRFSRESRVLLGIEHPNVVGALDVGRVDDTPYLVLEYVDGTTLHDRLAERALDPQEVLTIVRQAAEGLGEIHAHELVHRDIKPENLMITADGVVKLMDLGLAKTLSGGEDLTVTGSVFGTPGFMSPEAARDSKDTDIRSDIYSLGCTIYQALTRKLPFNGKTIGRLMREVLTKDPTPPIEHVPDLPAPVNALVMKMLQRDRELRPQDPAALLADIDLVMAGEMPAPAAPPKSKGGWWPFGKKKK